MLPDFNLLGFNYRMTDLQGAIGTVQLAKLDGFIAERQRWAEFYRQELADIPWLTMPVFPEDGRHAWQAFVTTVNQRSAPRSRNAIMDRLHALGIATRPGTHAIHMLAYYRRRFSLTADDLPRARDCDENTMAIPLHNRMTADDYSYVVAALKSIT